MVVDYGRCTVYNNIRSLQSVAMGVNKIMALDEKQIEIDESALNDAGWVLMDSYKVIVGERASPALFNNCKAILRRAIVEYLNKAPKDKQNNGVR